MNSTYRYVSQQVYQDYLKQWTPQEIENMMVRPEESFFMVPIGTPVRPEASQHDIDSVVSVVDSLSTVTSSDYSFDEKKEEEEPDVIGVLYKVLRPTVLRRYPRYDAEVVLDLNEGDLVVVTESLNNRMQKCRVGMVNGIRQTGWIRNLTMRYKCLEQVTVKGRNEEEHCLEKGTIVEVVHVGKLEIHVLSPFEGTIQVKEGKLPMSRRFKGKPTVALRNLPARVGGGKKNLNSREVCDWVKTNGFDAVKARKEVDGNWFVQISSLAQAKKLLQANLSWGRRKIYADWTPKFGYLSKLEEVFDE